jgi:hypothetical protein
VLAKKQVFREESFTLFLGGKKSGRCRVSVKGSHAKWREMRCAMVLCVTISCAKEILLLEQTRPARSHRLTLKGEQKPDLKNLH